MDHVTATRATTSPVIGHIEPVETITALDWETGATLATETRYRAHLADGTPAGRITGWGTGLAPATNVYPTPAKARAAVRAAHRYLNGDAR